MCSWHVNVNPSTRTIYVTNASGNGVSLINGATCNATVTCSQNAPAMHVEQLPAGIAVDQQTDAVHITSIVDGDESRIDGRACTPTHIPGCRPAPIPARMDGRGMAIALDPTAGTAYVPNNDAVPSRWSRSGADGGEAACRS